MYETAQTAVERARAGGGTAGVEALTLRGHGHAAHDDARYVPAELRARFEDPIDRLAARLLLDGRSDEEVKGAQAAARRRSLPGRPRPRRPRRPTRRRSRTASTQRRFQ